MLINHLPKNIDIFCRVVDNYGDIGVCWRLAKSLQCFAPVSIWVDDLTSFAKLLPGLNPDAAIQWAQPVLDWNQLSDPQAFLAFKPTVQILAKTNVQTTEVHAPTIEICQWPTSWVNAVEPADLVIEAFGCDLPAIYQQNMPGHTRCWLNLDYLSAEDWVENFHALPSIQANGVPKFFFAPGFTKRTGGLLREQYLLNNLQDIQKEPTWQNQFLKHLLNAESFTWWQEGASLVNIFCYPHAPIDELLRVLCEQSTRRYLVCVTEGVLQHLEKQQSSKLKIQRVPFLPQEHFDILLACADFNIVRGEDSFVRAHWAGKPFLWHIYPQSEQTHLMKLQAWLTRINAPTFVQKLQLLWNQSAGNTSANNTDEMHKSQSSSTEGVCVAKHDLPNTELDTTTSKITTSKTTLMAISQPENTDSQQATPWSISQQQWQTWQNFSLELRQKLSQQENLSRQIINFFEQRTQKS